MSRYPNTGRVTNLWSRRDVRAQLDPPGLDTEEKIAAGLWWHKQPTDLERIVRWVLDSRDTAMLEDRYPKARFHIDNAIGLTIAQRKHWIDRIGQAVGFAMKRHNSLFRWDQKAFRNLRRWFNAGKPPR